MNTGGQGGQVYQLDQMFCTCILLKASGFGKLNELVKSWIYQMRIKKVKAYMYGYVSIRLDTFSFLGKDRN